MIKLKRLIIENNMDLICLQEILKEHNRLLLSAGFQLSAISKEFVRTTLDKIDDIQQSRERGK